MIQATVPPSRRSICEPPPRPASRLPQAPIRSTLRRSAGPIIVRLGTPGYCFAVKCPTRPGRAPGISPGAKRCEDCGWSTAICPSKPWPACRSPAATIPGCRHPIYTQARGVRKSDREVLTRFGAAAYIAPTRRAAARRDGAPAKLLTDNGDQPPTCCVGGRGFGGSPACSGRRDPRGPGLFDR
jgi:hypothetical protein